MKKNSVRKLSFFLTLSLLFTVVLIAVNKLEVMAAPSLTVSRSINNDKVAFKVSDSVNINDLISILIMQKGTNSVLYTDQAVLKNGEYTFTTILPKGDYTGYVSSSSIDKVAIEDFSIANGSNPGGGTDTPKVDISSFDTIPNISAGNAGSAVYSNAAVVIAALPKAVKANNNAVAVPVSSWLDTDTYNPNSAGSYTFTAVLGTIPDGYTNSKKLTATVEVVIGTPQTYTVAGIVIDEKTGATIKGVQLQVKTEADGSKTITVKTQEAIVFKQVDGTGSPLNDITKLGFGETNGNVTFNADGTFQVKNVAIGAEVKFSITYDLGNNQKIVIGNIDVKVAGDGTVSFCSTLIDPYGIIKDAATGKAIEGVNVVLYYADTNRNKAAGKKPGDIVKLPIINGFKPNDNINPQTSDKNGAYAFMVFPVTDYYIVATKAGYNTYTSPIISVEQEIVEHNFSMNIISASEDNSKDKDNSSSVTNNNMNTSTGTVGNTPGGNSTSTQINTTPGTKKQDSNNVVDQVIGMPEIKFVGLEHSPLIEGDKEGFIVSSGFNGKVQYRIYLNIDSDWKEVTKGYSDPVNGQDAFEVTPEYKFQKGSYQGRVYVKKAGEKGNKEENGIDFDNYYTYNINCVDRDDANRVYTTGKLNLSKASVKVGEKLTVTGIDGISGIEGPYYYRLHIYDVANDKWTNNVIPYSEKLEWTPSTAGTYVLDIHVITPNSVLWDNIQKDPTLIYGGYEGWKLKVVKVS